MINLTTDQFIKKLKLISSSATAKSLNHIAADKDDLIIGVRMGHIFALAKEYMGMDLVEVQKLLQSPIHEARVGAVSIMDFQARHKKNICRTKKRIVQFIYQAT